MNILTERERARDRLIRNLLNAIRRLARIENDLAKIIMLALTLKWFDRLLFCTSAARLDSFQLGFTNLGRVNKDACVITQPGVYIKAYALDRVLPSP